MVVMHDGRANPLKDRNVVVIFGVLQWSPHPQQRDVMRRSEVQCNCSCRCSSNVVDVVEVVMLQL